jgi:hypothetical protein
MTVISGSQVTPVLCWSEADTEMFHSVNTGWYWQAKGYSACCIYCTAVWICCTMFYAWALTLRTNEQGMLSVPPLYARLTC